MFDSIGAWLRSAQGWTLAGVVSLHLLGAALFFIDLRLPLVLLVGVVGVVLAVQRPLWAVGLLIAGRLTSTGANAWVRIGRVNIDLFEPALLLAIGALITHAVILQRPLLRRVPWRTPLLVFWAFQVLGLLWSSNKGEAVQEIIATGVIVATTTVIVAFVRSRQDVRQVLMVWLGASLFVGVASLLGIFSPSESAFEMAQGSREGGLGQHPNWFAMNLGYAVPAALGLALTAGGRLERWVLWGVAGLIFFAQMRSGSRGGSWSIVLGLGLVSLAHPRLRRIALRAGVLSAVLVAGVLSWDLGETTRAVTRVWGVGTELMGKSVRVSNWEVCWTLFQESWGLGIGGGGYEDALARLNPWLYDSQYRYPHGIFWGLMAHYGVIGLALAGWTVTRIAGMIRDLVRGQPDPGLSLLAWTLVAPMLGYAAWSFVEFSYDDKPFWEFLGVFTALWLVATQAVAEEAK